MAYKKNRKEKAKVHWENYIREVREALKYE